MRRFKYWLRHKWAQLAIRPGDIYEDCQYRPMLCIRNVDGDLTGISLIDATQGSCSYLHCGVVKLSIQQVIDKTSPTHIQTKD